MKNFPEYNLENLGGLSTFNFIQQYNVAEVPISFNNVLPQQVVLKPGAEWMKGISYPIPLSFDEKVEDNDAGDLYSYAIKGVYPGHHEEITELLDEMKKVPLLIDCADNSGKRRLLGNTTIPCRLNYSFSTKETPSGRPEYSFTITWVSHKKAPFYAPA